MNTMPLDAQRDTTLAAIRARAHHIARRAVDIEVSPETGNEQRRIDLLLADVRELSRLYGILDEQRHHKGIRYDAHGL